LEEAVQRMEKTVFRPSTVLPKHQSFAQQAEDPAFKSEAAKKSRPNSHEKSKSSEAMQEIRKWRTLVFALRGMENLPIHSTN
jgi:hypothetical protein